MTEPRTFTDGGVLDDHAALLRELHSMVAQASKMHARLTEMDVRSGAVGAAKQLVNKIQSAIAFTERNGGVAWTEGERLACNAWRICIAVEDNTDDLPPSREWLDLDEEERERWRRAAEAFRSSGS